MRVAVGTINYNGRHYIGDCLRSLALLTRRPAAIIVVDNASTDGSVEFVRENFPGVTVIASPVNTGFTGGVNTCMRLCVEDGHEALLLLNPDTLVDPTLLEELIAAAGRHPQSLLSPMIAFADRPEVLDTYAGHVVWWRGRSDARYVGAPARTGPTLDVVIGTASGCCLFVPSEVIRDIGFLDEAYFLYFEDMDYLERARRAGHKLWYVPAARVLHREGSATGGGGSPLAMYYYVRNRFHFVRKFQRGTATYALFVGYSLLDIAARGLMFLAQGKPMLARAVARGAVDGWQGRMGPDRQTLAGSARANCA